MGEESENTSNPEQKKDFQNVKQSFELRKIKAEVIELEKKWWQKPSYLGTIITGLIGIPTIIITISTGLLSSQLKTIELKEQLLQIKTESFYKTIDSIKIKNARSLDSINSIYKISEEQKNLEIRRLNATKDSLRELNKSLKSDLFEVFVKEFSESFPNSKSKSSSDNK
ncbi:hypothetical protein [uncultured Dokdonia sp.]|uniref:hypothetical protein n=1 Tax=uncultured Dokdonia sp. TaxID=575653 RepID=UPI002602B0CA|nr:hypothetical protein [uncultured Dokdonia sp.]